MRERESLGKVVKISTIRKSNGAVGSRRKGTSGKKGVIFQITKDGTTELATATGSSFKDLSKKLRQTGHIPQDVALNKHGETHF